MAKGSAAVKDTTILLSSWATTTLEDVALVAPNCIKIYQIYLSKKDEVNIDVWARVKAAGYHALALTVDTQVLGKRENDMRNAF